MQTTTTEATNLTVDELKAEAKKYYDLGIPVIPFVISWNPNKKQFEKENNGCWKQWETDPQTDEEFNNLSWRKNGKDANGFGVLLGTKAKNGMYLAVIDYDIKPKPNETEEDKKQRLEATAKGKEILKDFPITQTEKTVNEGIHNIFWSKTPVAIDATFHDTTGLELLGTNKLCLMSPSFGYTRVNDNDPSEIPSLKNTFFEILKKHGFSKTEETETEHQLDIYSFTLDKLIDLSKLTKNGDSYHGSHPIHDSTTEKNFHVNIKKGTWYCFRHQSGGGALQYLAVKEGLIKCEDAKTGALRGKKFKKVLQIAATQGLVDQKILDTSTEFNPIILAKEIMHDNHFIVEYESDSLFVFNEQEGSYEEKGEKLIKREIAQRLGDETRARYYSDAYFFIHGVSPVKKVCEQPELLVCQNGVLNVLTRELKPHTHELFITNKIPVKYDKEAKCPKILAFLNETLQEKQQQVAQEYTGYLVYRDRPYRKSYFAIGDTGTGKTVHQSLTTEFLGGDNVSNQTLQAINHTRFATSSLVGKLGNFCDDMPSSKLYNTGNFKIATGRGRLTVERKGKPAFECKPYAKFWLNCNKLPPLAKDEDVDSYYERLLLQTYENVVEIENPNLINELTTPEELSGFLNYALDGLDRLFKQNHFSEYMNRGEVRDTYTKKTDPAKYFIEHCTTLTDEYEEYIFHDDLFRTFINFCQKEAIDHKVNKGELTQSMNEVCIGAQYTKIRKIVGYSDKGKPLKRLCPAWRYLKIVPNVPIVQPISNREKMQKNNNKKQLYLDRLAEGCTKGTNGTTIIAKYFKIVEFIKNNKEDEGLLKCKKLGDFIKSKELNQIEINAQLLKEKIIAYSPVTGYWLVI